MEIRSRIHRFLFTNVVKNQKKNLQNLQRKIYRQLRFFLSSIPLTRQLNQLTHLEMYWSRKHLISFRKCFNIQNIQTIQTWRKEFKLTCLHLINGRFIDHVMSVFGKWGMNRDNIWVGKNFILGCVTKVLQIFQFRTAPNNKIIHRDMTFCKMNDISLPYLS